MGKNKLVNRTQFHSRWIKITILLRTQLRTTQHVEKWSTGSPFRRVKQALISNRSLIKRVFQHILGSCGQYTKLHKPIQF